MNLVHHADKPIVGLIAERGRDDLLYSGAAGGVGEKTRVNTVAGDDPKNI